MSEKLRQFTTADGQTIYVKMNRKDYKAAMKAAQEGRPVTLNGNSVFVSAKDYVSRDEDQLTQNQNFAGTSLERGAEKMEGKKDYKARQKQYEAALKQQYIQDGMSEKEAAKIAKAEAKERIESEKAADEVISAVYFTPDEKDKYKAQKEQLEAQGKHAVLLTKDDMKRLGQFDELKGFVSTDENGKQTIADQDGLKVAAAKLVGDDNKVSYKERFDLTREAKDTDHKISHGSARITKNLFKHLGFDHAHDYTEAIIAGTAAAAAAGGALIGAGIVTGGTAAATTAGTTFGGVGTFTVPAVAGAGHALAGALIGAGVGAGLGTAASQIHDRTKVPEAQIAEETQPETQVETQPETQVETQPETQVETQPETQMGAARGRAVDRGIQQRVGFNVADLKDGTNPMQKPDKAQYILANEDGEVSIPEGDDPSAPSLITFKDNTNDRDNNVNTYTYRKLTAEEIQNGKLEDGTPISIGSNHDANKPLYVLVSADKQDGTDIKATHVEIYELNAEEVDYGDNTHRMHYEFEQKEGMSGYNQSSITYSARGTEGNNGANFRWGNWARQDVARQNKVKSYNAQSADDLLRHLQPAPNKADLIAANPSMFDSNGNVKQNADWSKLDLPKGTVFLD